MQARILQPTSQSAKQETEAKERDGQGHSEAGPSALSSPCPHSGSGQSALLSVISSDCPCSKPLVVSWRGPARSPGPLTGDWPLSSRDGTCHSFSPGEYLSPPCFHSQLLLIQERPSTAVLLCSLPSFQKEPLCPPHPLPRAHRLGTAAFGCGGSRTARPPLGDPPPHPRQC